VYAKFKDKLHPAVRAININCKALIKSAKRRFEMKLSENIKNDVKLFYAYAKSKTNSKVTNGSLVDDHGSVLTTSQEITEEYNRYFSTVFTKEIVDSVPIPVMMCSGNPSEALNDFQISEDMVKKKVDKLREDKAPGPDELSPRLLFHLKEQLAVPLCILFRKSLEEGRVPADWREANVTPIYKSGCRTCPGRPVSLTSQICKIV